MSNPVLILTGIVWKNKDAWYIGKLSIEDSLRNYLNKRCTVSLHHWPDESNNVCFSTFHCKQHLHNKSFLFNWKGELELTVEGLPIDSLEGHHSRIILVWEDFEVPKPNLEDIEKGYLDMQKLLDSLKETLEVIK